MMSGERDSPSLSPQSSVLSPRVLLLHASLGSGHERAAKALLEVLNERQIESGVQDLLRFLPPPMGAFYSRSYTFLITQGRFLWSLLYHRTDRSSSPYAPAKSWWQKWQFTGLIRYLQIEQFTHILSTHFATSAILADWRKRYGGNQRIYSVVTDYEAHRNWKRDGLDHYFVASDQVAGELVAAGIAPEKVTVSGIPVSPAFSKSMSRTELRAGWNCKPDDTLILILTSGLNISKTRCLIEDIKQLTGNFRFLVSAGKDPIREVRIKRFCDGDSRFAIFGFSPRIAEMMKASDLLLSKPGGLTVTEALAMGLPQVLFAPIPGQEEANADFALRHGAALCIQAKTGAFKDTISRLLADPAKLASMAEAARRLGKPRAAYAIIDQIL